MRAVAVDKTSGRSEGPHIFHCDVTEPEDYQALVSFLEAEKNSLAWVHFAAACGTARKAREKKQRKLEQEGYKMPQPLRTEAHPLGLPGLTGVDKLRTESANLVYEACANLIKLLASWGVCCTVENPSNSSFWCVPCIVELAFSIIVVMGANVRKAQSFGAPNLGFSHCKPNALVMMSIDIKLGNLQ